MLSLVRREVRLWLTLSSAGRRRKSMGIPARVDVVAGAEPRDLVKDTAQRWCCSFWAVGINRNTKPWNLATL